MLFVKHICQKSVRIIIDLCWITIKIVIIILLVLLWVIIFFTIIFTSYSSSFIPRISSLLATSTEAKLQFVSLSLCVLVNSFSAIASVNQTKNINLSKCLFVCRYLLLAAVVSSNEVAARLVSFPFCALATAYWYFSSFKWTRNKHLSMQ